MTLHHASTPARGAALVTGAARRVGRAIALTLAHDGWDVAVHYARSHNEALMTVSEIKELGRRACAVSCDLASESGPRNMLAHCATELGPLTCVVNSASIFERDEATSFTTEALLRHVRVNTAAPIVLAQALHATLPAHGQGVVINLLDQKLWNPNPDFLSYTLSKAALREATRLLAQALGPKLRVVAVAPGLTLPTEGLNGMSIEQFVQLHRQTPLNRGSTPADIAEAVAYLARAQAVTGITLLVDGGQHLVPSARDVLFT